MSKSSLTVSRVLTLLCLGMVSSAHGLPESNTIEFSNCTLNLPGTTLSTEARCGFLDVAENPDDPDGKTIAIHVAVAPAVARGPKPDPLFFFAGGPGQAASESYVMMRSVLEKIRKDRDIVLVDQRGTGQSNPLRCPQQEEEALDQSIDLDLVVELTGDCLADLDGDPRFYTTTIAVQDHDRVRAAMGYEQINLLGISYGTRAAQVYLRQFPDRVRSVILDSVVPMALNLGEEHAVMLDRAVDAVFADCEQDAECQRLFPAGKSELDQLIQSLRAEPREISFIHPTSGQEETLTVSAEILGVAVRFLSYRSETQAILPLLVHEAVTTGNLQRLASQAILVMSGLSEQLSRGMELSVICSEDYPFVSDEELGSGTILGTVFMDVMRAQCAVWARGEVPVDFHQPVASEVPVLLMSGARDPVTPPVYAAQTAEHFPNHLNLVGAGLGHAVISNPCFRGIAAEFIDQASVDELDLECVDRIEPAPFFSSLLGPNP